MPLLLLTIAILLTGCASGVAFKMEEPAKGLPKEIAAAGDELEIGLKLTYNLSWMGISAGQSTLEVKERTQINGRDVYHIAATAQTRGWISTFYHVEDEMHSYIDAQEFYTWRLEKKQKEGRYRANEVMEFDQANHIATYKSLRNNSTKTIEITPKVQDQISSYYHFRRQDLKIGESVFFDVCADEKVMQVKVDVLSRGRLRVGKLGHFDAFKVEPSATFKGKPVNKGRMWMWFSADDRRIPLALKAQAPIFGNVYAVLTKIEQ